MEGCYKSLLCSNKDIENMLRDGARNQLLLENRYNEEMSVKDLCRSVENLLDAITPADQRRIVVEIIGKYPFPDGKVDIIKMMEEAGDPANDPRICPVCGERAKWSARCPQLDSGCDNDHEWHTCVEHQVKVMGPSGPVKKGWCTCGDNLCPECGEKAIVPDEKNLYGDSVCANGHYWHKCFIHKVNVEGRTAGAGPVEFCTCGKISSEKEMREIKFRAWDKQRNEMVYEDEMVHANLRPFRITRRFGGFVLGILMQYTGRKDRDGKGIYEGDLVKRIKEGNVVEDDTLEVFWHHHASGFRLKSIDALSPPYHLADYGLLVVGNVYEGDGEDGPDAE